MHARRPIPEERALSARLSEVVDRPDRRMTMASRIRRFLGRPAFRGSVLRVALGLARDHLEAARRDHLERRRPATPPDWHEGQVVLDDAARICLFIHYAPQPAVSRMVFAQLNEYHALGFAIVFISMAPPLPAATLEALAPLCAAMVQRRNFGLDFGAWHDVLPAVLARSPAPTEVLLANDSLCGPFRSLQPVVSAMRAAPEGFYGLTENLAPRPHLQSYFLLARGRAAAGDLAAFIAQHRPTADKRRTIRRGEVALSAWMRQRGHLVAAWCGYEAVERAALARPGARQRLRSLYPALFRRVAENDVTGMAHAMRTRPVNGTHLFWRELVEEMNFPFIKTDLLLRNPLGIADAVAWESLLPANDTALRDMVEDHLALMGRRLA